MLSIRGFRSLIAIVFLNSFIDLGHKTVLQNAIFKVHDGHTQVLLSALVHLALIIPYIAAFTPSGFLADRFGKHRITQWAMASTIPLSVLTWVSYAQGWFWVGMGLMLLFSFQATFYAPARNGYLKELVGDHRLGKGNAYVQTAMVLSILTSALLYSVAFEWLLRPGVSSMSGILSSIHWIGAVLVGLSVIQTMVSWGLPAHSPGSLTPFNWGRYISGGYLRDTLSKVVASKRLFRSSLALGCMLGVNQMLLSIMGAHLKSVAGVTNTVITQGLIAIAGVGMMGGAIMAGRLSVGFIELGVLPLAVGGASLGLWGITVHQGVWEMGGFVFLFGLSSGLFIIPLTAMIQQTCGSSDVGKLSAADGLIQNVLMGCWLLATMALSATGISSLSLLQGLWMGMGLVGVGLLASERYYVIRLGLRMALKVLTCLRVSGYQAIPIKGPFMIQTRLRSLRDMVVLIAVCPRRIRQVNTPHPHPLWFKRWLWLMGISPTTQQGGTSLLLDSLHPLSPSDHHVVQGVISGEWRGTLSVKWALTPPSS